MYPYEWTKIYTISFYIDFKRNFSFLMRVLPSQPKIPGFLVGLSFFTYSPGRLVLIILIKRIHAS